MIIKLEFKGKMVSGKNQQQLAYIRGRVMKFPNKRFKSWRADFQEQVFRQLAEIKTPGALRAPVFAGPVSLRAWYFRGDELRRDATGILDAFFHAIEVKNGGHLVVDDAQVKDVYFWTMPIDRANPRLVFEIGDMEAK